MERRATRTRTTLAVSMLALTLIAPWALGQDLTETRRLAEQGDADAQYNLGVMYANGEGVPQDAAEAVRWYRISADVGLAFVDLDTYQTKWGSRTPEEVSLSVRTLHDEGIPAASLIVSSGRGLYLKWLFETPIPQSALPRWNAVQRELVERLQGFGADPMAKDASRVLRLVQTVHAKTGDVVRVLHVEEAEGEPKRYGFDRLAGAVLPCRAAPVAKGCLPASLQSGRGRVRA